jgi:hypothetical protein
MPATCDSHHCTCLGHLGRCDTDGIVSISCRATQGNFRLSLVLLSPMVSLTNVANVYDPLKYHLHWRFLLAKPSATVTVDCTCIGHLLATSLKHKTTLFVIFSLLVPLLGLDSNPRPWNNEANALPLCVT